MNRTVVLACVLCLCAVLPALAALPSGMTQVVSVEGITEYRLENGLRVLLFPDPAKQTVTVNITYLVGSRHENYGETGMAHLLEHLEFKGTPHHPDIPNELTAHGCRPNGSTWLDRTNYHETFPATAENLEWALDLEADRMVNSFIARKDLDSEMTVVRNEFEVGENNPDGVLEERVVSSAYLWHNYGKSTIGARSDIERVPIERLQAFYRTWYQPDNAVLVVGGKIDPEATLALVARKFGPIPRPTRLLPGDYTEEPAQDGERTVTLRRVGDVSLVRLAYHIPAGSHPDFAACQILAHILGNSPSGRLYKALVETKKATSVSGSVYQLHDPGLLFLGAQLPAGGSVDEVKQAMISLAEGAGKEAPSVEEVDRARASLLSDWEGSMRNTERAAINLSEWAAMGDWRLIFLHRDRLLAVKPEDVQRVAGAYLRTANRTVGIYLPTPTSDRVAIPAAPDLASILASYAGGQGMSQGEEFDVSPAHIDSLTVRTTLPNGMQVLLLPKKTRGSVVRISFSLHFGDEQSLKGRVIQGSLAADMLMRGSREHTRQQISDELDRLRATLRIFGGPTQAGGGLEVPKENLKPALSLLAEILRRPAFPPAEFELLKQEEITGREEAKQDPRQIARTEIQRRLHPWPADDVRHTGTPDEEIAQIKAADLAAVQGFYGDFYGATGGQIALVGEMDLQEAQQMVAGLFGDWKSKLPYTRCPDPFQEIAACDLKIETPDKESAAFSAGLRINLRDDDPDYPALVLGNFMTGGGFLNSRLANRIRRTEGLSYNVGSFFFAGPWEKDAFWGAAAICAPQNSEKLEKAFREEIARIVQDGFTDQEILEAKSGWLQSRKVGRSTDRDLARTLTDLAFQGRTFAWQGGLEEKVGALTSDQILQAVRRNLDPAKISIVLAGDFARVKSGAAAPPPSGGPEERSRPGMH